MIKLTLWLGFLAGLVYIVMGSFLYSRQRSMLYYPTPERTSDEAEVLRLSNEGETLKVWRVPAPGEKALIYFGGNAEDVALNIASFKHLFPGYAIYLHNYRGYGGSSGSATESALFSDALALYDLVAGQHGHIVVMGRSLGTGVAVHLAAHRRTAGLVLVTPYDSMARLVASYYPLFPVSFLIKDRYDSLARAELINVPTLVLVAGRDEVIPRRLSERLVAALKPELTSVTVVDDASHNTIASYPQYQNSLSAFLEALDP